MKSGPYFKRDYANPEGKKRSPRQIVPWLMELLQPQSVVDVGCGPGYWLAVFRELGVVEVLGFDGDWVDQTRLEIPAGSFHPVNLRQPLPCDRKFDLALSLEVAEHLPEQNAAGLVETLTGLSQSVLFSAAIPGQGGQGHVNEQWPEYWMGLFGQRGFQCLDCIRPRFWSNPEVEYWYAQNTLLFCAPAVLQGRPVLGQLARQGGPVALVHPRLYLRKLEQFKNRSFPGIIPHGLRKLFGRRQ